MRGRKAMPRILDLDTAGKGQERGQRVHIPTCPVILQGEAREEWWRSTPLLKAAGWITDLDRAVVALYCEAWGRWVEAVQKVEAEGRVVKVNGVMRSSVWQKDADCAAAEVRHLAAELGLPCHTRGRTRTVPAKPAVDAEWEGLIADG